MKKIKYLTVLTLPLFSFIAIHQQSALSFFPLIYAFGIIPFFELFIRPDKTNLSEEEEKSFLKNPLFDVMVYLAGAVHLGFFAYFFIRGA